MTTPTADNVVLLEDRAGNLSIWDYPTDGTEYVIGADLSEGRVRDMGAMKRKPGVSMRRDRPDFTSASVIELESGMHVASWHGYMEPGEFAIALVALALFYNEAFVVPEINGPGLACVDVVSKLYSNIYVAKLWNRFNLPDVVTTEFGWRTTQLTRPMLIQRVHDWLRGDPKTRDEGLVRELRTMEYDEQGTPRARGKNKDDRVFSLGLALQGRYEQLIEPDRQPAQQGVWITPPNEPGSMPRPPSKASDMESVWIMAMCLAALVAIVLVLVRSGSEPRRLAHAALTSNRELAAATTEMVRVFTESTDRQTSVLTAILEAAGQQMAVSAQRVMDAGDAVERHGLLRRLGIGDYSLDPEAHVSAVINAWARTTNCSSEEAVKLALASIRDPHRNQNLHPPQ